MFCRFSRCFSVSLAFSVVCAGTGGCSEATGGSRLFTSEKTVRRCILDETVLEA